MNIPQQQFLELLRSGLWGTPANSELFKGEVNWKAILRIAMEQTVQVLVADGIETLPKEMWPPKDAMMKLMMVRIKTEQMHTLLNTTLIQIVNALNAEHIPSVLLKGQGVAQNYFRPTSRMCGDIDLYVGIDNYSKACDIISKLNPKSKDGVESDHHMHLNVNGVEVEVHRLAGTMPSSKLNRHFQGWTYESIDANFNTTVLNQWDIDGTYVQHAPHTFDAFFILYHAVRHMTTEGVGFRQICDWIMYLHKHHSFIKAEELSQKLKEFHMEVIWEEFGRLAVKILGLPKENLTLSPSNPSATNKTDLLTHHIFTSGNFGRYDANGRDYSNTTYIKRKWRSFRFQSMRLIKLYNLFPLYTSNYMLGWFSEAIRRLFRGK